MAGVSLGGTGTGDLSVGPQNPVSIPKPDIHPDQIKEEEEYIIAYQNPRTQYCDGIERTIQFVGDSFLYVPMKTRGEVNFVEINNPLKQRYKLELIIKNTTSDIIYEYVDACRAAIQLTGWKTEKKPKTNFCLNNEVVNSFQPNESRTYYYTFNLPDLSSEWGVSYNAQYSNELYTSSYSNEEISPRSNCETLSTSLLLIEKYPINQERISQEVNKESNFNYPEFSVDNKRNIKKE
ncbi:hypothetical protein [Acinetobacter calcoaceticus]|uniref:hypothetical protein n=1 Tax=Acinetobacter calcoaceticus TaxID=471 RepID=UPI00192B9E76|nr:hypothetical protein [Acinetobacter calcoaceticus]